MLGMRPRDAYPNGLIRARGRAPSDPAYMPQRRRALAQQDRRGRQSVLDEARKRESETMGARAHVILSLQREGRCLKTWRSLQEWAIRHESQGLMASISDASGHILGLGDARRSHSLCSCDVAGLPNGPGVDASADNTSTLINVSSRQ